MRIPTHPFLRKKLGFYAGKEIPRVQSCGQPTRGPGRKPNISPVNLQALPPDVQRKFEIVANRNSISSEELFIRNKALSHLIWEVIQIFELNFRHFLNVELSRLAKNQNWWLDAELIHKDHLLTTANPEKQIQFLSFGFLSLLLSDRYHKKLWVSHLKGTLKSWVLPRRILYRDLRILVRLRNRIAHHEIIYNYPLEEIVKFAATLLSDINSDASAAIIKNRYSERIHSIKLGSGGGI